MTKISKPELTNFFMHLCADLGKKICLSDGELEAVRKWGGEHWQPWCEVVPYGTVGAWLIENQSFYGGWRIEELTTKGGGISCPFGHTRYRTKEFFNMICFAREALRIKKQGV